MKKIVSKNNNRGYLTKIVIAFAMAVLVLFLISFSTNAATNNEIHSSIYLTVKNAPKDYFIVPLECNENHHGPNVELEYDEELYRDLKDYITSFHYDYWEPLDYPSETETSIKESNPKNYYEYTYIAPNPVRILIVDKQGNIYLSDILYRREVKSRVTYDVSTGKLTENLSIRRARSIAYIIVCLLLTLALEIPFLKVFEFPFIKRNLLLVILMNVVTNLSENLYLSRIDSGYDVIKPIIIFGILTTVLETAIYTLTLKTEDGIDHRFMSMFYGIAVNVLSAILLTFLIFTIRFIVY